MSIENKHSESGETVTVCAHCSEAIERVGADALDYCENCQLIEGETREVTLEEYEAGQ